MGWPITTLRAKFRRRRSSRLKNERIPFSHYVFGFSGGIAGRFWRLCCTSVLATFVVASRLTPIYESTATIDVDRQTPTGILGEDSVRTSSNDADQYIATQMDLIKSDSVLRPVVQKFQSARNRERSVRAGPHTADQRRRAHRSQASGGDPPPNTYLLRVAYRSTNARLAADVANGIANSYLEHSPNIKFQSTSGVSRFMEEADGGPQGQDGTLQHRPRSIRKGAQRH